MKSKIDSLEDTNSALYRWRGNCSAGSWLKGFLREDALGYSNQVLLIKLKFILGFI